MPSDKWPESFSNGASDSSPAKQGRSTSHVLREAFTRLRLPIGALRSIVTGNLQSFFFHNWIFRWLVAKRTDSLIFSPDPLHPANQIPYLCAHFYSLGWVTGTGGGATIRRDNKIYLAPSGVQKELIKPQDIFVLSAEYARLSFSDREYRISHHDLPYLRRPQNLNPSACTPLFMTSFRLRDANCCIHTHSHWAVMVTLLVDKYHEQGKGPETVFEIQKIEQIKGVPKGADKQGNLGYEDKLQIPIIENTPKEEDLTDSLEKAILDWPDTYAVLVKRHGIYVWGENVAKAKTICESMDYLFRLAVDMERDGIPWT